MANDFIDMIRRRIAAAANGCSFCMATADLFLPGGRTSAGAPGFISFTD